MGAEAVNDFFQKSQDKSTIRFCTRREQGIGILLIIIIIIIMFMIVKIMIIKTMIITTKKRDDHLNVQW